MKRYGVNFMGCFGAFTGLSLAKALADQDRSHRVLLVCTELCSLHLQPIVRPDAVIANALFSDGAAAVIVADSNEGIPVFELIEQKSFACENSRNKMTWTATETCLMMGLAKDVPQLISDQIIPFTEELLSHHTTASQCDWAIHPGGKEILTKIEKTAKLQSTQTLSSWNILAKYGNMSSATILFVLEELLQQEKTADFCCAVGVGPGLALEGILLRHG